MPFALPVFKPWLRHFQLDSEQQPHEKKYLFVGFSENPTDHTVAWPGTPRGFAWRSRSTHGTPGLLFRMSRTLLAGLGRGGCDWKISNLSKLKKKRGGYSIVLSIRPGQFFIAAVKECRHLSSFLFESSLEDCASDTGLYLYNCLDWLGALGEQAPVCPGNVWDFFEECRHSNILNSPFIPVVWLPMPTLLPRQQKNMLTIASSGTRGYISSFDSKRSSNKRRAVVNSPV